MSTDTPDPKATFAAALAALDLSITSVFVPWSSSRSYVANGTITDRSLNWIITVHRAGRAVLSTDYTAGLAHAPAYRNDKAYGRNYSLLKAEALTYETERGLTHRAPGVYAKAAPILPDPTAVLWSILQDADALDAGGFESWAGNFGCSVDSRKAEATYRACVEIALKLRAAIGDEGVKTLRVAAENY